MASATPIQPAVGSMDPQQHEFIHNSQSPVFAMSPAPAEAINSGTLVNSSAEATQVKDSSSDAVALPEKTEPASNSAENKAEEPDANGDSTTESTDISKKISKSPKSPKSPKSSKAKKASNTDEADASALSDTSNSKVKTAKPVKLPAPISDISKNIPVTGEKPKPEKDTPAMEDEVLHAVFVILYEFDTKEEGMTVKQMCDHLLERHPDMAQLSTKLSNLISAKLNAYVKKVEKGEKTLTYCLSREWADTSPRRMVYVYRGLLAPDYQTFAQEATKKMQEAQEQQRQKQLENGDLSGSVGLNYSKMSNSPMITNAENIAFSGMGNSTLLGSEPTYGASSLGGNPKGNNNHMDYHGFGGNSRMSKTPVVSNAFHFAMDGMNNSTMQNINRFSITYDPRFSSLPFQSTNNSFSSTSISSTDHAGGVVHNFSDSSLMSLNSHSNTLKSNNNKHKVKGFSSHHTQLDPLAEYGNENDAERNQENDDDEDEENNEDEYIYNTDVDGIASKRGAFKQLNQKKGKMTKKNGASLSSDSSKQSYTTNTLFNGKNSHIGGKNDSSSHLPQAKYITAAAAAPRLTKNSFQNDHFNSPQVAAAVAAIQKAVITESPVAVDLSYTSSSFSSVSSQKSTTFSSLNASSIDKMSQSTSSSSPGSLNSASSLTPNSSKSSSPEPVCAQWLKAVRAGFLSEDIVKPENVSIEELDGLFD
ncbi:hypothetical protein ACO0QE_003876 [Hanseniaspora vineae]